MDEVSNREVEVDVTQLERALLLMAFGRGRVTLGALRTLQRRLHPALRQAAVGHY